MIATDVRVHFVQHHPRRDRNLRDWLLRITSPLYRHCILEVDGRCSDLGPVAFYAYEADELADFRGDNVIDTLELGPREVVEEVIVPKFGYLTCNCSQFIATVLGLPRPKMVVTPSILFKGLDNERPRQPNPSEQHGHRFGRPR